MMNGFLASRNIHAGDSRVGRVLKERGSPTGFTQFIAIVIHTTATSRAHFLQNFSSHLLQQFKLFACFLLVLLFGWPKTNWLLSYHLQK